MPNCETHKASARIYIKHANTPSIQGEKDTMMKSTVKKTVSVITVLCILVSAFCVFTGAAGAASGDRVKLYSAETYFCKYGVTGTTVYVQTRDNASNQQVTVHYNYLKGQAWKDSEAEYFTTLADGSKIWKTTINSYNTEYAIKYVADGVTVWDNNNGKNYTTEMIGEANITALRSNHFTGNSFTVFANLKNLAYEKDVKVRYTANGWASYQDVPLHYVSTGTDGSELWSATVNENAYTGGFQYCISYTANGNTYWANNFGKNYDTTYRVYP